MEQELDLIFEEYKQEVFKIIGRDFFVGGGCSTLHDFYLHLSDKNGSYINSKYFYEGKRKFVHWTSLQNLMSIINSRELRLYNLHNSSDEEEFEYASSRLPISYDKIEYLKNFLYTFSFCEQTESENPYLWTEYGKNYEGVAVEFEIMNDPKDWEKFMMGKVIYDLPNNLIDLKEKLELLKIKYPNFRTSFDFGKLISFYKNPIKYENEKEVRISILFPFEHIDLYNKYCKTDVKIEKGRNRFTSYFPLSLYVENDDSFVKHKDKEFDNQQILPFEDYFIKYPKIKITKIQFGEKCGLENVEFATKFCDKLEEIFNRQFGYKVEIPTNLYKKIQ